MHADHHLGLNRIIQFRHSLLRDDAHEPLHIIGPLAIEKWLSEYNTLIELSYQFTLVSDSTEVKYVTLCIQFSLLTPL